MLSFSEFPFFQVRFLFFYRLSERSEPPDFSFFLFPPCLPQYVFFFLNAFFFQALIISGGLFWFFFPSIPSLLLLKGPGPFPPPLPSSLPPSHMPSSPPPPHPLPFPSLNPPLCSPSTPSPHPTLPIEPPVPLPIYWTFRSIRCGLL